MKFRVTASMMTKTDGRIRHAETVTAEDIGEVVENIDEAAGFDKLKLPEDGDRRDIIALEFSIKRIGL